MSAFVPVHRRTSSTTSIADPATEEALSRTRTDDPFLTIEPQPSKAVHERAKKTANTGLQWPLEPSPGLVDGPQKDPA